MDDTWKGWSCRPGAAFTLFSVIGTVYANWTRSARRDGTRAGGGGCGEPLLIAGSEYMTISRMNSATLQDPAERLVTPRLRREYRTMECMVEIWCGDHHGPLDHGGPCTECREFLAYAARRLEKCPYGEAKPTCAKCPIHCYKRAQREHARVIMRYAGPRMTLRHPWLSFMHIVDKLRKVEHPMETRRRKAQADE